MGQDLKRIAVYIVIGMLAVSLLANYVQYRINVRREARTQTEFASRDSVIRVSQLKLHAYEMVMDSLRQDYAKIAKQRDSLRRHFVSTPTAGLSDQELANKIREMIR